MTKLANIYGNSGEGSGRKNDKLKNWFLARDEQMSQLDLDGKTFSSSTFSLRTKN